MKNLQPPPMDEFITDEGMDQRSKVCALICVDEIDSYIQQCTPKDDPYCNLMALEYWQEVKEELKTQIP